MLNISILLCSWIVISMKSSWGLSAPVKFPPSIINHIGLLTWSYQLTVSVEFFNMFSEVFIWLLVSACCILFSVLLFMLLSLRGKVSYLFHCLIWMTAVLYVMHFSQQHTWYHSCPYRRCVIRPCMWIFFWWVIRGGEMSGCSEVRR